jgi:hypothetical protein
MLVSYSDSDDSDQDAPQNKDLSLKNAPAKDVPSKHPESTFTVDKNHPRRIQVNLQQRDSPAPAIDDAGPDGESSRKKPRLGGGLGGFNSMLPAPKQSTKEAAVPTLKGPSRKVFSLKTGAEPGFSREADAELRQVLAGQGADERKESHENNGEPLRGNGFSTDLESRPISKTKSTIFKPLSVARNANKKKKPPAGSSTSTSTTTAEGKARPQLPIAESSTIPVLKVSLFPTATTERSTVEPTTRNSEYRPFLYNSKDENEPQQLNPTSAADRIDLPTNHANLTSTHPPAPAPQLQSLDSIANDLNLSASARRQLLGRKNHREATRPTTSVMNFNTDEEYAANEAARASGDQAPSHNPVRAIAPGKHSLKQLVSAASGQKDALEESFATGRRNKREAGGRYGW